MDPVSGEFGGELLTPESDAFQAARAVFNMRLVGTPKVIARCQGAADVRAALRLAEEHGLPVAVRGGGHSGGGWSSINGGLVIDLTAMRSVRVDPDTRTAWVGGGACALDLIAEAVKFGLAPVTGVSPKVGLGGLLLGLGEGYLTPRYGFGTDNVLELEVVTADGRILEVSPDSHPELFWAMRGAGANFGVASAIKVRLHPAPSSAVGGWITFGHADLEAVTRHVWQVMANGSSQYFPLAIYELDDAGRPQVKIIPGHTGRRDEAQRDMAELRNCATPVSDTTRPMSYLDLINEIGGSDDSLAAASRRLVWDVYRLEFDGDSRRQMDTLLEQQSRLRPSAHFNLWRTVPIEPPQPVGVAPRLPGITLFISSYWERPEDDHAELQWARDAARGLIESGEARTAANTMNHVSHITRDRVRELYGPAEYERLAALKSIYDPGNTFHRNCNIRPGDGNDGPDE